MPSPRTDHETRPPGRPGEHGFTLLELLVVLVILGLLAAVATPQVLKYLGSAKTDAARIQIQSLASTLDLYRLDIGQYPSQQEGLLALVEPASGGANWRGPYVKRRDSLLDPWGQPYHYAQPGSHGAFDIFSLGSDKAEGGSGEAQDVTSW